jgi:hypothetical protein
MFIQQNEQNITREKKFATLLDCYCSQVAKPTSNFPKGPQRVTSPDAWFKILF